MHALKTESSGAAGANDIDVFVETLTDEDKMLLRLREELYEGRWDAMLVDLNDRLRGKPVEGLSAAV